jgi:hypothetical protein
MAVYFTDQLSANIKMINGLNNIEGTMFAKYRFWQDTNDYNMQVRRGVGGRSRRPKRQLTRRKWSQSFLLRSQKIFGLRFASFPLQNPRFCFSAFCNVTLYSLIEIYWEFGRTWCLHLQFRKVDRACFSQSQVPFTKQGNVTSYKAITSNSFSSSESSA